MFPHIFIYGKQCVNLTAHSTSLEQEHSTSLNEMYYNTTRCQKPILSKRYDSLTTSLFSQHCKNNKREATKVKVTKGRLNNRACINYTFKCINMVQTDLANFLLRNTGFLLS